MKTDTRLLAYYDSMAFGLIPCRIVGYHDDHGTPVVEVELTAARGTYDTYRKGQRLFTTPHFVVRRTVRVSSGHLRVATADHDAAKAALMA